MSTHLFCNDLDYFVISFPTNVDYIDLLLPPGEKHLQPEICLGCRVLVLLFCDSRYICHGLSSQSECQRTCEEIFDHSKF